MKKAAPTRPNELLSYEREQRHWTQEEVAEHIGAPDAHMVGRWERGVTQPAPYYRQRLMDLFGKSARALGFARSGTIPFWSVPYRQNTFFTGREDLLDLLYNALNTTPNTTTAPPQALCGLGGVGKTQIALEYAYRHRLDYQTIAWIRADSRETLTADMVALAALLELPESLYPDQQHMLRSLTDWLSTLSRWLLIFDNLDDLTLLDNFLPTLTRGHVLLTTRNHITGTLAHKIEVETMSVEAGALFLLQRAKRLPAETSNRSMLTEHENARLIAKLLGGLPLALDQAGAYIEETGDSFSNFLTLYQTHRADLLQWRSDFATTSPESVFTTWFLAFKKIRQANPLAGNLLHFFAFLDSDGIPETLLTQGASASVPHLAPLATNPLLLERALKELRKFSLVRRQANKRLLSIHRLVQAVLLDRMEPAERQDWVVWVIQALDKVFPEIDYTTWKHCELYLPHILACLTSFNQTTPLPAEALCLLDRAGYYLTERTRYAEARHLLDHALALAPHARISAPSTLISLLHHRGLLAYREGNYSEAADFLAQGLAQSKQAMIQDALILPRLLNTQAKLAITQGQYVEAQSTVQQALTLYERILGADQPETATCRQTFGLLCYRQGNHAQAEVLLHQALLVHERVFGKEHPTILAELGILAEIYRYQGKYTEAEQLVLRVLRQYEQRFGLEYPNTAQNLYILAEIYSGQKRYAEAEQVAQRALVSCQHIWGDAHPTVANCLCQLAGLAVTQEKHTEAEALLQRALTIYEHAHGMQHPSTADCLKRLAAYYLAQRQVKQAEEAARQALHIYECVVGLDHRAIVACQELLAAILLEEHGQGEAAEGLHQRTSTIQKQ